MLCEMFPLLNEVMFGKTVSENLHKQLVSVEKNKLEIVRGFALLAPDSHNRFSPNIHRLLQVAIL